MNSNAKIGLGIATALLVGFFLFRKKPTASPGTTIGTGNTNTGIPSNTTNPSGSSNQGKLLPILTKIQTKPTGAKVYKEAGKTFFLNFPGSMALGNIINYTQDKQFYVFQGTINGISTSLIVGVNDVEIYKQITR